MLHRNLFSASATAIILSACSATVQGGAFADLDANGDAMLSQDEMTAAYGADGSARFMARDSNGDGMLTAAEFGVAAGDEPDYRDASEPAIETEGFDDQGFGNTDES